MNFNSTALRAGLRRLNHPSGPTQKAAAPCDTN
jgi:hypothetical protein